MVLDVWSTEGTGKRLEGEQKEEAKISPPFFLTQESLYHSGDVFSVALGFWLWGKHEDNPLLYFGTRIVGWGHSSQFNGTFLYTGMWSLLQST